MNIFIDLKKQLGKRCVENELLSGHTTLCIGGPARLFYSANSIDKLIKAVRMAKKYQVDYLVIGGGSNLLVSDDGFDGLIIENSSKGIKEVNGTVVCESGTVLQDLINYVIKKGYSGMEKMSGIPGTVGGAVYGNAGAYGQEISNYLIEVEVFDGKKKRKLTKKDCGFKYRDSSFKKNKFIILQITFEFDRSSKEILRKVALDTINIRLKKYPPTMRCPGSFFRNLIAEDLDINVLENIPEEKIIFGKIPAGFLMESVGAKGARRGGIQIADYHGNLIINTGAGTAQDFYDLAMSFSKKIENKYKIKLEPEVQLVGFDEK